MEYVRDLTQTEIVNAPDVVVGDGIWDIIEATGKVRRLSDGRRIDEVRRALLDDNKAGRLYTYGPWTAGAFDEDEVRITKRGMNP